MTNSRTKHGFQPGTKKRVSVKFMIDPLSGPIKNFGLDKNFDAGNDGKSGKLCDGKWDLLILGSYQD